VSRGGLPCAAKNYLLKLVVIFRATTIGIRARGLEGEGCGPPDSGKSIIFRAKTKFFGQKSAAKSEKKNKHFFVFIKRKKTEFMLLSEIKCPKSGIFTNNYWVGCIGKVILQVSITVFSGTVEKFFRQRWLSPPRKNCSVRLLQQLGIFTRSFIHLGSINTAGL